MSIEDNQYLREDKYEKVNQKIKNIALIVLVIALVLGGGLITVGLVNMNGGRSSYEIEAELEARKTVLESQTSLTTTEQNELSNIKGALKDAASTSGWCSSTYRYSTLAAEMCDAINRENGHTAQSYIPFFMIGGFIILAGSMSALTIYMRTKGRSIMAHGLQTVAPLAKDLSRTMADIKKDTAKDWAEAEAETVKQRTEKVMPEQQKMNEYEAKMKGERAKEVAKGIKEGLKDE